MTNQQDTALLPVAEETLKPCPFCGAELRKMSEQQGYWHPEGNCTLAGFHMEADGYSEGRWNTRAEQAKPSGEADEATAVARIHGGFAVGEKNGQRRYVLLGNDGKFYSAESLNGPWQEWPPATGDDSK